jgi:hypothetical protein
MGIDDTQIQSDVKHKLQNYSQRFCESVFSGILMLRKLKGTCHTQGRYKADVRTAIWKLAVWQYDNYGVRMKGLDECYFIAGEARIKELLDTDKINEGEYLTKCEGSRFSPC